MGDTKICSMKRPIQLKLLPLIQVDAIQENITVQYKHNVRPRVQGQTFVNNKRKWFLKQITCAVISKIQEAGSSNADKGMLVDGHGLKSSVIILVMTPNILCRMAFLLIFFNSTRY